MLLKPAGCSGCVLQHAGQGYAPPEGFPELGVTLMGEASGEQEAKAGRPFVGPAGLRLGRMIERAGYERRQFQILNAVGCQPPKNAVPPDPAIDQCKQYWRPRVELPVTKVIVPMGNVALGAVLGLEGILSKRGYVWWSEEYQAFVLPTVHPSYIIRGNSNWEAAFLYDLRHAVQIAAEGWEPKERDYCLDPSPGLAMVWAEEFLTALDADPTCALSYDIETPDKSAAEDETDINLGYQAGPIFRIGFAYVTGGETRVLSIPWDGSYRAVIDLLMQSQAPKVVCYRHFDVPRIQAHGVVINGDRHDIQEMWHILHSDLPKKLEHMAPFLCPQQAAWKHLSSSTPALYNGIDAGVEIEAYWRLRVLLQESGMWQVYDRHVFQLNPILLYMTEQGMPIDLEKRKEAALRIGLLKEEVRLKLNTAAEGARPTKIYKRFREGLTEIAVEAQEKYCSDCGKVGVGKKHPCFKVGVAEGEVALGVLCGRTVTAKAWALPLDFKPSHTGLLRYAKFKGYRLLSRWDKQKGTRVHSMDENAVRKYALAHTEDAVWQLALEERELTKLQGTYIGRLTDKPLKTLSPQDAWWEAWRAAQYAKDDQGNVRVAQTVHLGQGSGTAVDDDVPF